MTRESRPRGRRIRDLQVAACEADTPDSVAERTRRRAACEQATRECRERFPVLTAHNAGAALRWQEERIAALLRRADDAHAHPKALRLCRDHAACATTESVVVVSCAECELCDDIPRPRP